MKTHEMPNLPLDSATTMGVVGILGTILPATGLSQDALKAAVSVLDALAEFGSINEVVPLVPENPTWCLNVKHNLVNGEDFEHLLIDLRLNASRIGVSKNCFGVWIHKDLIKNLSFVSANKKRFSCFCLRATLFPLIFQ